MRLLDDWPRLTTLVLPQLMAGHMGNGLVVAMNTDEEEEVEKDEVATWYWKGK